jgi:hypothetical protein
MTPQPPVTPDPLAAVEPRLGLLAGEPLPAGVEPELRRVDDLLAVVASEASVPRHLADLVYDATVGWVWQRQAPLSLKAARMSRATQWGRLAMAAAVALAFVVGASVSHRPVMQSPPLAMAGMLPLEAEHLLMEPAASEAAGVWYLLETRDVTFDELTGDLQNLVDELEM